MGGRTEARIRIGREGRKEERRGKGKEGMNETGKEVMKERMKEERKGKEGRNGTGKEGKKQGRKEGKKQGKKEGREEGVGGMDGRRKQSTVPWKAGRWQAGDGKSAVVECRMYDNTCLFFLWC